MISTLVQVWTWGKCDHGELGHGAEVQVPRRVCLPRFHCGARQHAVPRVVLCGRPALQPTPGFCYDMANAGFLL